jgi:hypothetical protein
VVRVSGKGFSVSVELSNFGLRGSNVPVVEADAVRARFSSLACTLLELRVSGTMLRISVGVRISG